MSLDGIAIHGLAHELEEVLVGGRIDKIQQPDSTTITLSIRQPGQNYKLLLSSNPQTARLGLTTQTFPNPLQPPLFCMVLRKHLEGSKILSIRQMAWERVVQITCEGYDELGELTTRVLIGEFMGKHSNIVLINPEKNTILDSIKRLSIDMSQYRQILPGLSYVAPPPQNKRPIDEITLEELMEAAVQAPAGLSMKKILLQLIAGLGPQTALELVYRSGLDPEGRAEFLGEYDYLQLMQSISHLVEMLQNHRYQPTIVYEQKKALAFAPFALTQYGQYTQITCPSLSEMVELFIGQKESQNGFEQRRVDLERIIDREIERCQKKLALQMEKVEEGEEAEHLKIWGELITANLYHLKQGPLAEVINYYDPEQATLVIPLASNLTPNENAQKYFKRYAKAKIGAEKALMQSAHTQEEIDYLGSIEEGLASAQSLQDLQDVRLELETGEYVKAKLSKQQKKSKKEPVYHPLLLEVNDYQILVGKNNVQNDYLTLKIAKNHDLWFHAKDIPGSHVVIKNHQEQRDVPKEILDLAAHLAAYFSKGKFSSSVPVDYTLKKYVKKPSGAKPGRVIYDNQKTIYITPDEEAIDKLLSTHSKKA